MLRLGCNEEVCADASGRLLSSARRQLVELHFKPGAGAGQMQVWAFMWAVSILMLIPSFSLFLFLRHGQMPTFMYERRARQDKSNTDVASLSSAVGQQLQ